MLSNAVGLILADVKGVNLGELTEPRALAAVPIGGRFRLVDFMLSNMVNSGIKNVGVVAIRRYMSLLDHLGSGLFWDLDRMQQGLTIIPPVIASEHNSSSEGDLTGLFQFLRAAREDYVVISNGNLIMNIQLEDFLSDHKDSKSEMTVLYQKIEEPIYPNLSLVLEDGYVKDLLVNSLVRKSDISALGIVILKRKLLLNIIADAMAHGKNLFSIERLLKRSTEYRVRAVEYSDVCLRITSLSTFYDANMKLLDWKISEHLFDQAERPIYTKVKNEAPAYYEKDSEVSASLVSDGCSIYGKVTNCILFRGVHVAKGAVIQDSIIFQDSYIAEGADLNHVILDKNTFVQPHVKLQGQAAYPVVIEKGARV